MRKLGLVFVLLAWVAPAYDTRSLTVRQGGPVRNNIVLSPTGSGLAGTGR